jgi:hypothetical protein
MNDYYVYQLRDPRNELPFYVGKGRGYRAYEHLSGSSGDNKHKNNTIHQILREGYEVQVEFLWVDLYEKDALRREVWVIHLYGRKDKKEGPLTNKTDGGEGVSGHVWSEEQKLAISGCNHPMYGKAHTEEAKANMKLAKSNCPTGPDHPSYGRILTAEHKAKISRSLIGKMADENNPMYGVRGEDHPSFGKKHSEASNLSNSVKHSKNYLVIRPDGCEERIFNMKEFCIKNQLNHSAMYQVAKGKASHHKGYRCIQIESN